MKNQIAGWQAVYMSFYSKPLYKDVVRNWKGLCYTYLFMLIFVTQLALAFKLQKMIDGQVPVLMPYAANLPLLSIKKGVLGMDKPSPYEVSGGSDANAPVLVFDFDGKSDKMPPATRNEIRFYKQEIVFRRSNTDSEGGVAQTESRQILPEGLPDVSFGSEDAKGLLQTMQNSLAFGYLLAATVLGFIFSAILALAYGLAGMALANLNKATLTYGELIRISVVAMTPVILIDAVMHLFLVNFGLGWSLMTVPITLAFLYLGTKANSEAAPEALPQSEQRSL